MARRRFRVLLEWDPEDRVWVTYVPDLDWLSSYGETKEEALEQTREAVLGYVEAAAKEGLSLPTPRPVPELIEVEVAVG
ncbi:MAG: type II toxin-antitoxin system HicB family antitoxin [Bacillota bacterium]